ncbi:alpha/beta hydrolase [Aureococcus anophagefferens]|nr:alpha/beta hydrolase [Aureococcus anophagefferens]
MGAGASASAAKALTPEEQERIAALHAMDPELQKQLAFKAMTDVLATSVASALAAAAVLDTWTQPAYAIPVPNAGTFYWLAETVGKVPLVGSKLAGEITNVVDALAVSMKDAALTVARDARTKACYDAIIADLQPAENMVELCAKPGGAFADALTGIAAYNSAASKIPGCEPMDFDLDKYVLDQILATIGLLVRSNEAATRACVPADASDAVKQVFGGGMRDPDELIMALVLVPKGEPRQFVVEAPKLPTKDARGPIKTTGGLSIVLKDGETTCAGGMNYAFLGVGQPTDDDAVGVAPQFYLDGKFLVAEACGKTLLLDFCYGRYHEGNRVVLANSTKGDKETFAKHRSTELVLTKEQTLQTCRNSSYVLGIRLDENKPKETPAADEAAVLQERELAAAAAAAKEAEAEAAAAQTASAKPRVAAPGPLPPKRQPELEFLPGLPLNDENHMEPDYDGTSTLFPYGPPGDAAEPAPAEVSRVGADGIRRLYGVSVPTLTLHWPRGRRSDVEGAQPCVIVAPGGGYDALVIDREGHDVAEAFAARGFVAFVLKYRVPMEIPKPGKKESNDALADLQRAVSYVRAHADQFGVDADAVGVAGFDTGAHLAARAVGAKRAYGPIDWVDESPATPSFLILNALLPPGDDVAPSSHVTPKDRAPPAFVAHAVDDAAASYTASMDYFENRAGPRSQLAIYDRGGHD